MPRFVVKVDIARQDNCEFLDEIVIETEALDMDDARMLVMIALQSAFPRNSVDCMDLIQDVNEDDLPEYGEGRGMEPTKENDLQRAPDDDLEVMLSGTQLKATSVNGEEV